jgi:hypothetical protein
LRRDRISNNAGKYASQRHQLMLLDRANLLVQSFLLFLPLPQRRRGWSRFSPSYMLALMNW